MCGNIKTMSITNVTLGMNQTSTDYGPFPHGSHAGTPVVDFTVSEADDNQMEVRSIEGLFERYKWDRKVNSGFARLQFSGQNVFKDIHLEGISEFSRLLDARFVDFEVGLQEFNTVPPREVQNIADYYRVFVPEDYDFDERVMDFYTEQANNYGNVDFIFKVDSSTDDGYIEDVSREYTMYDSDVWLFPKGWKMKTVSDRYKYCEKFAKSNAWNVSPRLDIMSQYSEDE